MLINVRVGTASKVQRLLLGSVSKYTLPAGISWASRDIPFCYFSFYNYFLLGFTSHISLMSNRGGLITRLRNDMRLALGSSRLDISRGVTGSSRLSSRLGVPTACSGEDTATSECQQHLVVVDRSAGRSALGSPYRFRQAFDHQQWAPIRWLTSIVVCYADRCDPRPPQYRTFVLTDVYTHPDSKCCVQATSSALPVQHLTLSAALSVCRNVVGISAFFFRLRR